MKDLTPQSAGPIVEKAWSRVSKSADPEDYFSPFTLEHR
jgi:hypothetical protein